MFGRRITLFKVLGFAIRLDMSWIVIAVLVTWSLAVGFFPMQYEGLAGATYWWMGVAGALGLFVSILVHELSHAIMARRYGVQIKGITLFIFGGVAEMEGEPPHARAEFMIAIVGPITSFLIAFVFYGAYRAVHAATWPVPAIGVVGYLSLINALLAVFNLVPGFPLDGGRILRSILWGWKQNLRWATRVASRVGSGFGMVLILLGVLQVLRGHFVGGMWWFLIGMFLRGAANMSYQQVLMRQALEGEPVRRFMKPDPVTVPPGISVEQLVEDYIYKHHYKLFPVVKGGALVGSVSLGQVKEVPRAEWAQRAVGDLARPCSRDNTIGPNDDATKALALMSRTGASRLMVVDGDRLVGIIALKDLLAFLALKVELEEGEDVGVTKWG
jgi:Zn-dependent protease/CBS domain-containing protein